MGGAAWEWSSGDAVAEGVAVWHLRLLVKRKRTCCFAVYHYGVLRWLRRRHCYSAGILVVSVVCSIRLLYSPIELSVLDNTCSV